MNPPSRAEQVFDWGDDPNQRDTIPHKARVVSRFGTLPPVTQQAVYGNMHRSRLPTEL